MKSKAANALADAIDQAAAKAPARAQDVEPQPIPAGLSPAAADLWLVDEEINATRRQLARARAPGSPLAGRTAALQGQLYGLLDRRQKIRPPELPTSEDEERRWRVDADATVRLIEAGVEEAEARTKVKDEARTSG